MRQLLLLLISIIILAGCVLKEKGENSERNISENHGFQYLVKEVPPLEKIPIHEINEEKAFLVTDFIEAIKGNLHYDEVHRTLSMEIGNDTYKLTYGIPVIEKSGLYLPIDDVQLLLEGEAVYLSLSFLEKVLGLKIISNNGNVSFVWSQKAPKDHPAHLSVMSSNILNVEEMTKYLSFLNKPIEGAKLSTISNHLPGAKRPYRNGYHEGIDWYPYASGQHISTTTPVYAMAEGIVVRVDHHYEEYPSHAIRNEDLAYTAQIGETPQYIFDRLRGRQVWIQYDKGVMIRFAHLSAIPENLHIGDKVYSSTIIGYVGNSGTSGAVNNDDTELHLHQDILIYGEMFWEAFSLEEVQKILEEIFRH